MKFIPFLRDCYIYRICYSQFFKLLLFKWFQFTLSIWSVSQLPLIPCVTILYVCVYVMRVCIFVCVCVFVVLIITQDWLIQLFFKIIFRSSTWCNKIQCIFDWDYCWLHRRNHHHCIDRWCNLLPLKQM